MHSCSARLGKPLSSRDVERLYRVVDELSPHMAVEALRALGSPDTYVRNLYLASLVCSSRDATWIHIPSAVAAVSRRGGRRPGAMSTSLDREQAFMSVIMEEVVAGAVITAADLWSRFCRLVGKVVCLATIYRLLSRHGWYRVNSLVHRGAVRLISSTRLVRG
jgi:hypothetical protein